MEEVLPRSSPVDAVPMDPLLTKYDLLFFGQKLGNMPNWLCPFASRIYGPISIVGLSLADIRCSPAFAFRASECIWAAVQSVTTYPPQWIN